MLGKLSEWYESGGRGPGTISDGNGDRGGKSYGLYQIALNPGTLSNFIQWMINSDDAIKRQYGTALNAHELASEAFDSVWLDIANNDGTTFARQQHEYIEYSHYGPVVRELKGLGLNIEKHSEALKDVLWSRAVHYPAYAAKLFKLALKWVPGYTSDWDLSYVDDKRFDYDLIVGVYEQAKIWNDEDNMGSAVYEGLANRFESEKQDALKLLMEELNNG